MGRRVDWPGGGIGGSWASWALGVAAGTRTNGKGALECVALATGGGPSNQSQIAGTGCQRKRVDRARAI